MLLNCTLQPMYLIDTLFKLSLAKCISSIQNHSFTESTFISSMQNHLCTESTISLIFLYSSFYLCPLADIPVNSKILFCVSAGSFHYGTPRREIQIDVHGIFCHLGIYLRTDVLLDIAFLAPSLSRVWVRWQVPSCSFLHLHPSPRICSLFIFPDTFLF